MKTSVKNMMMSLALMGCLVIGASDASAQGRSRSHGGSTSRSQSAAVSRSSSNATTPSVSRNSGTSRSSSAAPQVSRSSSSTSRSMSSAPKATRDNMSSNRTTTAPQVSRSSSSTTRSTTTPPQVNRDNMGSRSGHGATSRGNNGTGMTRRSDSTPHVSPQNPSTSDRTSNKGDNFRFGDNDRKGNRPGGSMGNDNKGHGDNKGNGGRPSGNGSHDNKGKGNLPGGSNYNPGGHDKGHGGNHDGNRGYNPKHRYDYNSHHYRDQFSWNHSHHNWSRPLPPPARAHRPAPLIWRRPVIPAGWRPYAGAPVIDRILGLMFGSLYEASLDHLYYNGYYIDGYADNIIYLRDVSMLNLYWPDAMLSYEYGKLANAQFVYHSSYYDRTRFDRAYNSLCRIYGPPVFDDGMTISWYGGNRTGWVTLTMNDSYGDYYTTMSIGY